MDELPLSCPNSVMHDNMNSGALDLLNTCHVQFYERIPPSQFPVTLSLHDILVSMLCD